MSDTTDSTEQLLTLPGTNGCASSVDDGNDVTTLMHKVTVQEVASSLAAIKLTFMNNMKEVTVWNSVGASFVQQPAAPEAQWSPGAVGSSIIGMLEVIESVFTKKLAEPSLAEDEAENGYQKATQENNVTKVSKEQDVEYKEQECANLTKFADESTSERDSTNAEFSAIVQYFTKLNNIRVAKE